MIKDEEKENEKEGIERTEFETKWALSKRILTLFRE